MYLEKQRWIDHIQSNIHIITKNYKQKLLVKTSARLNDLYPIIHKINVMVNYLYTTLSRGQWEEDLETNLQNFYPRESRHLHDQKKQYRHYARKEAVPSLGACIQIPGNEKKSYYTMEDARQLLTRGSLCDLLYPDLFSAKHIEHLE